MFTKACIHMHVSLHFCTSYLAGERQCKIQKCEFQSLAAFWSVGCFRKCTHTTLYSVFNAHGDLALSAESTHSLDCPHFISLIKCFFAN